MPDKTNHLHILQLKESTRSFTHLPGIESPRCRLS